MTIHLGFEISTGKEVSIPLAHLAVTGQTQQSGKTTTLEALVARSGIQAVAFLTKGAEGSFRTAAPLPPFFRERADWQFVASILEATMRERLKFERPWIIRACHGARTLAEVHRNVRNDLPKARGIHQSVLTALNAYLELVLPQISRLSYSRQLKLGVGLNAMELSAMSMEVQALVIRSVLEEVYEKHARTVTIIPEAWEFIPQQRGSPVLLACEELIRKGAAGQNYVWLDSQDIAGVHKNVLRQVSVWILGVQREANEVKRALAHIPLGSPKPTPRDVMTLSLGTFYVCFGDVMKKVYVQPAWLADVEAKACARGIVSLRDLPRAPKRDTSVISTTFSSVAGPGPAADAALEFISRGTAAQQSVDEILSRGGDEAMWKEKYEAEQREVTKLKTELNRMRSRLQETENELNRVRQDKPNAV